MICDWCGLGIVNYADHFARPEAEPCKRAALVEHPVQMLDGNLTHDQIRRRALRTLARTGRQDRLETLAQNTRREKHAHHDTRIRRLTQPPG